MIVHWSWNYDADLGVVDGSIRVDGSSNIKPSVRINQKLEKAFDGQQEIWIHQDWEPKRVRRHVLGTTGRRKNLRMWQHHATGRAVQGHLTSSWHLLTLGAALAYAWVVCNRNTACLMELYGNNKKKLVRSWNTWVLLRTEILRRLQGRMFEL